ncbi:hypothetical protein M378DRAFT_677264 [Amanita muscaria Koide BX008]|uniref:Uncharacterized protein n=1 Tax=Amanita muscaria (strain Koide BX008) TaxID=946122 RepID=A0A0C2X3R4_AMAMK|nr:hypothetical protein M378DRAFT_677264 [Amanita muscaria Koide BX008]
MFHIWFTFTYIRQWCELIGPTRLNKRMLYFDPGLIAVECTIPMGHSYHKQIVIFRDFQPEGDCQLSTPLSLPFSHASQPADTPFSAPLHSAAQT